MLVEREVELATIRSSFNTVNESDDIWDYMNAPSQTFYICNPE